MYNIYLGRWGKPLPARRTNYNTRQPNCPASDYLNILSDPQGQVFLPGSRSVWRRNLHLFSLWLITLVYRSRNQAAVDFFVCLDDLATLTPERGTAIATAASRNLKPLSYLRALDHAVEPATGEKCEDSMDGTIAVEIFGGWVARVSQSWRCPANNCHDV